MAADPDRAPTGAREALRSDGTTIEALEVRLAEITIRLDAITRALADARAGTARPGRRSGDLGRRVPGLAPGAPTGMPDAPAGSVSPAKAGMRRWVPVFLMVPLVAIGVGFAACAIPALLGYRALVVSGGSMEPSVPLGSVAFTRVQGPSQIAVGDVIVVNGGTDGRGGRARYLHRVRDLQTRDGRMLARTHGDANARDDPGWVELDRPVPVLAWSVPFLGFLMSAAVTPVGWVGLVVLPGALGCAGLLHSVWATPAATRRRRPAADLTDLRPGPAPG